MAKFRDNIWLLRFLAYLINMQTTVLNQLYRISERMDNPKILLHYLLQEYLVEMDINFISVNLRC